MHCCVKNLATNFSFFEKFTQKLVNIGIQASCLCSQECKLSCWFLSLKVAKMHANFIKMDTFELFENYCMYIFKLKTRPQEYLHTVHQVHAYQFPNCIAK